MLASFSEKAFFKIKDFNGSTYADAAKTLIVCFFVTDKNIETIGFICFLHSKQNMSSCGMSVSQDRQKLG